MFFSSLNTVAFLVVACLVEVPKLAALLQYKRCLDERVEVGQRRRGHSHHRRHRGGVGGDGGDRARSAAQRKGVAGSVGAQRLEPTAVGVAQLRAEDDRAAQQRGTGAGLNATGKELKVVVLLGGHREARRD